MVVVIAIERLMDAISKIRLSKNKNVVVVVIIVVVVVIFAISGTMS